MNDPRIGEILGGPLSWRMISSKVIVRPNSVSAQNNKKKLGKSTVKKFPQIRDVPRSTLPQPDGHIWEGRLRTPKRTAKSKLISTIETDVNPRMSKNCEQLFAQMLSNLHPLKGELHVDPSYSVRRIVKGSGLFQAAEDTNINNEISSDVSCDGNSSPNIAYTHCNGKMTSSDHNTNLNHEASSTFNYEEFMRVPLSIEDECSSNHFSRNAHVTDPLLTPYTGCNLRNEENSPEILKENNIEQYYEPCEVFNLREQSSSPAASSYLSPSSQYDTLVLQKTIETQVVQLMPNQRMSSPPSSPSFDAVICGSGSTRVTDPMQNSLSYNVRRRLRKRRKYNLRNRERSGYDPSSEGDES